MLRKPLPLVVLSVVVGVTAYLMTASEERPSVASSPMPIGDDPSAAPSASPSPVASPGSSPGPARPPRIVSIGLPTRLNGRPMLTDTQSRQVTQDWVRATSKNGYTGVVAAFYGSRGKQDQMWVDAAESPYLFPHGVLAARLRGYAGTHFVTKVDTPFEIDEGPLGGYAMCAKMVDGNGKITYPTTVCQWSNHDSYGTVTWYQKTPGQVIKEFMSIRSQIEQVNTSS